MTAAWGVALLWPGDSFGRSAAYADILRMQSEETWGAVLLLLAILRIAALIINGHAFEGSPAVRGVAAALTMAIWLQFGLAFAAVDATLGAITIGLPTTLVLAGVDLFCVSRSGLDFITARRARMRKGRAGSEP